jgi:hypothetical protein
MSDRRARDVELGCALKVELDRLRLAHDIDDWLAKPGGCTVLQEGYSSSVANRFIGMIGHADDGVQEFEVGHVGALNRVERGEVYRTGGVPARGRGLLRWTRPRSEDRLQVEASRINAQAGRRRLTGMRIFYGPKKVAENNRQNPIVKQ